MTGAVGQGPRTFDEFWPRYVGAHRRPGCRALHYVGGVAALAAIGYGAWSMSLWPLLVAPVIGYGFAWTGHFCVERNRPATFGAALWSLRGEFKMLRLGLTGRMAGEVARLYGSSAPSPDAPLLVER